MKFKDKIAPVITIALILLVWYAAAAIYDKEILLPSPKTTLLQLVEAFKREQFWQSIGNTMLRSVTSFLIAFACALALALLAVKFNLFYKLFYPVVVLFRAVPTIAVIFICYIALKGWFRAVFICFLVIFPTLFASFYTSIKGCSMELKEVTAVYKVSAFNSVTRFIIPSVWNSMYSEIVNTLSLTVKLIVAAEAVTATGLSLGGLMAQAKAMFEMGDILAYTVVAILLSYAAELTVRLIAKIVKGVSRKCRSH